MKSQSLPTEDPILLPETLSRRKLPINFQEKDLGLFQHELEKQIPATTLLELENVRVSSDGLLFRGLNLLPESFAFPDLLERWKRRSLAKFFVNNYLLRKRRRISAAAVWIVDDWSTGYFHWLADALPRLYVVRDRLKDLILLLPHQYSSLDFVRPSLEAFGVKNFEFIDANEVLICNRLFLPTPTAPSGHYNENVIHAVRKVLLASYGEQGITAKRIYISRSRALKRRIVNEDEVKSLLQKFDFLIVEAEDRSFAQQVAIASSARYLISNHGAGLTNMLFMKTEGSVLELRHETDALNNCYFTMAAALNLNYFYQSCQSERAGEDAHTANLVVDVGELKRNIKQMLEYDR